MRFRNLILSLYMFLGLLPTSFSGGTMMSVAGDTVQRVNLSELPKIAFLFLGITLLVGGISYLMNRERNSRAACITLAGLIIVFAYFFVLH